MQRRMKGAAMGWGVHGMETLRPWGAYLTHRIWAGLIHAQLSLPLSACLAHRPCIQPIKRNLDSAPTSKTQGPGDVGP